MGSRDRDGAVVHRAAAGLEGRREPRPFASLLYRMVVAAMGACASDLTGKRARQPYEAIAVTDPRACVT